MEMILAQKVKQVYHKKENVKYYKVIAPMGHQGAGQQAEITFYFYAKDAISAMNMAMRMPGVKKNRFALSVIEISKEDYDNGRQQSAYTNFYKWEKHI